MTLAIGDHVVKLDRNTGKPAEGEGHIEFEVLSTDYGHPEQTVKLKVIR